MHIRHRVSCPITDKKGRVIAVLCGHPKDPNWESGYVEAASTMQQAQHRIRRTKKNLRHRCGHFTALAAGVSFEGGQRVNYYCETCCMLLIWHVRSLVTYSTAPRMLQFWMRFLNLCILFTLPGLPMVGLIYLSAQIGLLIISQLVSWHGHHLLCGPCYIALQLVRQPTSTNIHNCFYMLNF